VLQSGVGVGGIQSPNCFDIAYLSFFRFRIMPMPSFWQRQLTCMGVPQAASWRYGSMSCDASHFDFCVYHPCLPVRPTLLPKVSPMPRSNIVYFTPFHRPHHRIPSSSNLESFPDHLSIHLFFRNDQICAVKGWYIVQTAQCFAFTSFQSL
jgi:hypothetical protein